MAADERLAKRLRGKARRASLEVEDLLSLVPIGAPQDVALLDELLATPKTRDDAVLHRWRAPIASFLEHGYAGLRAYATEENSALLAVGVLEELRTEASVELLLELAASKESVCERATRALNLILSFKPRPVVSPQLMDTTRALGHRVAIS